MKLVRLFWRIVLLSVVATAFVGLTQIYGTATRTPVPGPRWQARRQHRPLPPRVSQFPEFAGEGILVVLYALAGRMVFRLRLSPVSRHEGRPISLNLQR